MAIDWEDPCAAATALRAALGRYLNGERAEVVELEVGTGSRRRVHLSKCSVEELRREYAIRAEECNQKGGGKPRRHAVV